MQTSPVHNVFALTPSKAPTLPRVLLIYTGGTIGMVRNPQTGVHEPLNFEHLVSHVPELSQIKVAVSTIQFEQPIDSSNMTPHHWAMIARIIVENYEKYDGFVVLHGTDTMAYTASALSYMLDNLQKPVILTGSQLPIGVLRTDGKENLITAIEMAADHDRIGQPMVPEVCVYFQSKLLRGNRSKKLSAEEFNAFRSPNYPALAEIGVHITYAHHHINYPREHNTPLRPRYSFCTDVVMLKLFPGISQMMVHSVLAIPSLRGVVLETFGAGNAMTESWFLDEIASAVRRGVVVINVTQCIDGMVEMSTYDTGNRLNKAGVISAGDMTTEATITKLMFLLGQGQSQEEVGKNMLTSIAGEID
ncbi:MAG: asparaginase [Bacteroidales bacterium]|nr:asparaginase [Candidatus Liminaster caballi]